VCEIAFLSIDIVYYKVAGMRNNVILSKFHENLYTSDLQFGFKQNSSTNMCTMILKETVAYYLNKESPVLCTFLDASKAFDRFKLL